MFAYARRTSAGYPAVSHSQQRTQSSVLSRDPARSRPPTDRPLDIVGLEVLVCVTQALLVGLLLSLANDLGGDARAVGLPVPGLLAILGLAVGAAWVWWLVGGSGWPLAAVDLAVALLTGALWLLSLQDSTAPHLDPLTGLIAVSCAVYGIVAGVFLPGPRRAHWKGGASRPRRGLPDTRATPARFSPPVQKVVDERLAAISLSTVSLSGIRLPSVNLPTRRSSGASDPDGAADGALVVATSTSPTPDSKVTVTIVPAAAGTPALEPGAADAGDVADVPTLIHRILTGDEPLSVSAMRLSGIPPATADLSKVEDEDEDEDETLPFPTVTPDPADVAASDSVTDEPADGARPATGERGNEG